MKNVAMITTTAALLILTALGACSAPEPAPAARRTDQVGAIAVARGRVDVEGGLLIIGASRDGTVREVLVEDGQRVLKDQILARLDERAAALAVASARAEQDQARAQFDVLSARLKASRQQAQRTGAAAREGVATGQAAMDASGALAVQVAEQAAAKAGIEIAHQRVLAAELERAQLDIRAPLAGTIIDRSVRVGDRIAVQSGRELFRLLPEQPLIVRAELGEDFVDRVHAGMRAEIIPDADPQHPLPAHVLRVGAVFGLSQRRDDPQQSPDARVVDCVLAIDAGSLRIGQQVLVRIRRQ